MSVFFTPKAVIEEAETTAAIPVVLTEAELPLRSRGAAYAALSAGTPGAAAPVTDSVDYAAATPELLARIRRGLGRLP